jgi:hypothetical protein
VNDKSLSIEEQKVSNLQMFLIFLFFHLCIDQCERCDVVMELINIKKKLFECKKELCMIVHVF